MDHFWKSITPVHDDAERHSTDQKVNICCKAPIVRNGPDLGLNYSVVKISVSINFDPSEYMNGELLSLA